MEDRNNNRNNEIYDSLKGYFPEKYDMSPEELEKEIETEKKEQSIALGFTDPARSKVAVSNAVKADETAGEAEIEADVLPDAEVDADFTVTDDASVPEETQVDSDSFSDDITGDDSDASDTSLRIHLQDSENDLTENKLLDGYDSLDELFNELEADTTAEEEKTEEAVQGDEKARKVIDWFFDFLEVFTVCMACIILFFSFIARLTRVDGDSMNDTLIDGQYLVVSDLFYKPAAGDIVVLQNTSLDTLQLREPLVKRIIALGGETVHIDRNGKVTVTDSDGNEKELDQSFTKAEPYMKNEMTYKVPEGCVFVMGDNRNNSTDSRDYHVGPVDERCIFGKAYFRVLPFGTATAFKNPYTEK